MYPQRPPGWAEPTGFYNYYQPSSSSPHYWRKVLTYNALVSLALLGIFMAINFKASKLVAYQSSVTTSVAAAAPAPEETSPKQPAVAQVPDFSPRLQAVLNQWAASHPGQQWSVAVQGLKGNASVASLNQNSSFNSASIYKLFLTYPLFKYYSLDSLSGNFVSVEGKQRSLKDCADSMLKVSDNPCGIAIGNKLGLARSNKLLKQLGLASTNINNAKGPVTTASDTSLFLQKLYGGQLMDARSRDYVLNLLRQQVFRDGIPTGCTGCTVADKTGELDSLKHDVGIVEYSGGAYGLSIFSSGASFGQIAQLTSQIHSVMSQPAR